MNVFGKEWFNIYNPKLISIANILPVRLFLNKRFCIDALKYIGFTHCSATYINISGELKIVLYTRDSVAALFYKKFRLIWHLMHTWDIYAANKLFPALNFGFDTLTAYTEPNSEAGSHDLYYTSSDSTYSSARGASAASPNFGFFKVLLENNYTDPDFRVRRGVLKFDTSGISNAEISAAELQLHFDANSEQDSGQSDVIVTAFAPAGDVPANSDFQAYGSEVFATYGFDDITNNQYNSIALSGAGIEHLNPYGSASFGLRLSGDYNNQEPTGTNKANFYAADEAGIDKDPKLIVTFQPGQILKPQMVV